MEQGGMISETLTLELVVVIVAATLLIAVLVWIAIDLLKDKRRPRNGLPCWSKATAGLLPQLLHCSILAFNIGPAAGLPCLMSIMEAAPGMDVNTCKD